mmetsp:Transcript_5042/g.14003  ORF Transcript_5042/g.14003 Transcript_5042/m.14003 type:complete len:211 (+) Transcript_5042:445-1077(+)
MGAGSCSASWNNACRSISKVWWTACFLMPSGHSPAPTGAAPAGVHPGAGHGREGRRRGRQGLAPRLAFGPVHARFCGARTAGASCHDVLHAAWALRIRGRAEDRLQHWRLWRFRAGVPAARRGLRAPRGFALRPLRIVCLATAPIRLHFVGAAVNSACWHIVVAEVNTCCCLSAGHCARISVGVRPHGDLFEAMAELISSCSAFANYFLA